MSPPSVETQKVLGLFPGYVNVQGTPSMYKEEDVTKEVPRIHSGDDVSQDICQMEDMKNCWTMSCQHYFMCLISSCVYLGT